ncbi:MAG: EMC3/TMCO1 family protein [Nanoarchaeota archaeon]|nr:EMC3/TMCO1 family protein [Nanoarchaeota archaeon]
MVDEQDKMTGIIPNKGSISHEDKKGSMLPIVIIMFISLFIAFAWDKFPVIKNSVHAVLNPTAGALLKLNIPGGLEIGMIIIVFLITLISTLVQKFATDQNALRELKKEQKILNEEMKKYKEHPEKVAELSKKQMEFIPKTMKLTSRSMLYTGVPFILFFRWFSDVFTAMGNPKFFGIMGWFLFYFIFTIVFSAILKKVMKVV